MERRVLKKGKSRRVKKSVRRSRKYRGGSKSKIERLENEIKLLENEIEFLENEREEMRKINSTGLDNLRHEGYHGNETVQSYYNKYNTDVERIENEIKNKNNEIYKYQIEKAIELRKELLKATTKKDEKEKKVIMEEIKKHNNSTNIEEIINAENNNTQPKSPHRKNPLIQGLYRSLFNKISNKK